ncbi:MAG: hypothetical protein P4L50_21625 [Anaerolineaceae bacterium]|nr:hypothetical protein [Anaerolineaceae bacterium]
MNKNVLIILCKSLLLLILSACSVGPANTARTATTVAASAAANQYLGNFHTIAGTTYLYAEVSQRPTTRSGLGNIISSISSSEDYGSTTNLVFLNTKTLDSHKLFAANDQTILDVQQFPDPNAGAEYTTAQAQPVQPAQASAANPATVVQWLVYQIAPKDTSQPSAANTNLPFSIGVSDASGNGYQELLSGLKNLYAMSMINNTQLLVVYDKNKVKSASILDLDKKTVSASNPIVDLGAGVQ